MMNKCILCGSDQINPYYTCSAFAITSDSKIVKRPLNIWYCRKCCNLSKRRKAPDRQIIDKINESMVLYGLDGISEHRVAFDKYSGGINRSRYLLEYIQNNIDLDNADCVLDYGCHYGAFLNEFNANFPDRSLFGYDVSCKFQNHIRNINKKSLFTTDTQKFAYVTFDLIVISHVLEHVENPIETLQFLKDRLRNNGYLCLLLVNTEDNPFAPLIFEQNYNFTSYGIGHLLELCGYEIVDLNTSWIAKEIALIVRKKSNDKDIRREAQNKRVHSTQSDLAITENFDLLNQMEKNLYNTKSLGLSVGVFGTAIAASWAGSILDTSVKYYVDEDKKKHTQKHLGKKVIPPEEIADNDTVYILLPEKVAKKIVKRLAAEKSANYIIPPFNLTSKI